VIYFDAENEERLAIAHEPFAHKPISVRKKIKSSLDRSCYDWQWAITTVCNYYYRRTASESENRMSA